MRYYYSVDEQGSNSLITYKYGKIRNVYWHDEFGNVIDSNEDVYNRIKYTSQRFDEITQQYYLRARFYNPVVGRFTQEDVYRGDGLNLYAYCGNNPVGYYDPSGYASRTQQCNNKGKTYAEKVKEINDNDANKVNKTLSSWLSDDSELLEEVTDWYNNNPEWWSIDPGNTPVFYRNKSEVNAIRKLPGEKNGHHRHGLALGGEVGQKLKKTGETGRNKNKTHSTVTGLQRRVINKIKKQI